MKKKCSFITVGYSDDGKRIRKRIYYSNQSEYNQALQALMRQYDGIRNGDLLTLETYIKRFKGAYVSNLAISTQGFYDEYLPYFRALYPLKLVNITKSDLQIIINENANHPTTCRHLKVVISRVFNCAIDDGYLSVNPAKKLVLPQRPKKERRAFTDTEIKAILSADYTTMGYLAVLLFYYFGLRPEELRGLMPSDFDFNENVVHIRRAVVYDGNEPVIKTTKTGVTRTLPLPPAIIPRLEAYISDLRALYLFHDQSGCLMTRGRFRVFYEGIFKAIDKSIGVDGYCKFHGLTLYNFRHTVGVRLYYSPNVSNKYSAKFLGHSEAIFISIYSHLDERQENIQALYDSLAI